MRWEDLDREACSVARTLSVIGDRWTLLILRDAFLGQRRFEGFEASLGITRHILADRLKKLTAAGVLQKRPYQEAPRREEYRLTEKGLDLYPVLMGLIAWGDKHMPDRKGPPVTHEHLGCGKKMRAVLVCSECGEPLAARNVRAHLRPDIARQRKAHS